MARRILAGSLLVVLLGAAPEADPVWRAIHHPDRPAGDLARDARSKPLAILHFLGVRPGMRVADLEAGTGYYTELLSRIVGEDGQVFMQNSQAFLDVAGEAERQRTANNRLPNVVVLHTETDDLKLPRGTLDAILMVLIYHDLYFRPEDCDPPPAPCAWNPHPDRYFEQLREALVPGGALLVIDHVAAAGSGNRSAQTLHRIEPAFARRDIESRGFVFDGQLDVLRNPHDDHSLSVFDPKVRGHTDRFVYRFRKPSA